MIIIADSGSTKCTWAQCSTNGEIIKIHQTVGLNPKYTSHNSLLTELEYSSLSTIRNQVKEIHFYGAGCSSNEKNNALQLPMQEFFHNAQINIMHDLEAAIKATYKGVPIICCILGTGSNSCLYDGKKIIEHGPSLGYILGDHASGNYFGKKIINSYFNNIMPKELNKILEKSFETNADVILDNVYNNNRANVFLSSYFPFITQTQEHLFTQQLIKDSLTDFINLHIKCFSNYNKMKINFIGSVAFFLSDEIKTALKNHNLQIGKILKNPINQLIKFHAKNSELKL